MHKSVLSLFLIAPLALYGCTDKTDDSSGDTAAAGEFDLTVSGTGYDPHDGNAYEVAVLDSSNTEVASDSGTQSGGTISWSFPGILADGGTYSVHFYFDLNGNSACDSPPDDHGWSYSIGPISEDTTLTEDHDTDFTDVCGTF